MKVICTEDLHLNFTKGKEYEVLHLEKTFFGNSIYGYWVENDKGEQMWLFPDEAYVPLKIKKNPRWRAILKAKGYKRLTKDIWLNQETGAEVDRTMMYTLRSILGRDYTMLENIKGAESTAVLQFKRELEEALREAE